MSGTENLLVHLKLNSIIEEDGERKVIDENGKRYPVVGNAQVVEDEELGNCIRFDGNESYISLGTVADGISNQITTQAWINPDILETSVGLAPILSKHGWSKGWELRGAQEPAMMVSIGGGYPQGLSSELIRGGEWTHLAGTYDGSEIRIYVNGQLAGTESATGNIIEGSEEVRVATISIDSLVPDRRFRGKIASVRLYDRALSAEEIQRDMEEDRFPRVDPPFRDSYPLGFDLHDEEDQNVLYIDSDPEGRDLHFSVLNTSRETVAFSALTGEASKENNHLQLKFRPGTLANWEQIALAENGNWNFKVEENLDKTISLYFLSTATPEIAPSGQLNLTLQKVSADGSGGARGTRVEFKYRNLKHKNAADGENLEGTRVEHLSIVNQRGKQNIPLYVSFVSSNNVLNDGASQNQLDLRITSSYPVSLAPPGGATPKFILFFDSGDAESKPWALGTDSQVEGINVKVKFPGGDWQDVPKSGQGSSVQWEIEITEPLELDEQNFLQLQLSSIITGHPSGHANLYVRYENIPGYWDSQFVSAIEKAPLLYKDFANSQKNVGIGTTNLDGSKLKIAQSDSDFAEFKFTGSGGQLLFESSSDGWEISTKTANKNLYLNPNNASTSVYIGQRLQGFVVRGNGYVGIGTTDPQTALDVRGGMHVSQKVGIGVADPRGELHVMGNSRIEGNLTIDNSSGSGTLQIGSEGTLKIGDISMKIDGGELGINTSIKIQTRLVLGITSLGEEELIQLKNLIS